MLTAIWLITHRYQGLTQDARIYAMQALARINPTLKSDLYLQNTSQDHYTFFSPFYAGIIQLIGLKDAARFLTVLFTIGFLTAAWVLTRTLVGRDEAWLALGLLILTVGTYGAYRVFHFSEDYLTARLPAEALIAMAIAIHSRGFTHLALLIAIGALVVHPLMALPGLLLLIFLTLPMRVGAGLAIAGVASILTIALAATNALELQQLFPVLDATWLNVVRERSQFLFLQLWSLHDWELNIRPFMSLALSAIVFSDMRIRKLCFAAALVGVSGLVVAGLASAIGPVALLLQAQAWRWVWITAFISVVLVTPTAIRVWRDEKCGPLCAILLVASWTISEFDAPLLTLAALVIFLVRAHISDGVAQYMKWAALASTAAILYWILSNFSTVMPSPSTAGAETPFLQRAGAMTALRPTMVVLLLFAWHYLRVARSAWIPTAVCGLLAIACVLLLPMAFNKIETIGSASEISEFADWQHAIPPSSNVYVANGRDAAPFAWFTLQRPSYLSLDQSAGVVFSRATALEVQRRSAVLLPLMDEDWKLLSKNLAARTAGTKATPRWTPLTAKSLASMCSDPQLGFLIARENVGFDPIRHRHAGPWNDWNLYDCGHVRSVAPAPDAVPSHDQVPTHDEMAGHDAVASSGTVSARDIAPAT